ncbi:hypothetical protein OHS70_23685 [Streptomyces sp. NBC_00390]|uniref:hypothetical protein n=1 Tax=Streptomyces sp. NBC_00390 TaxID=2975736 RepID=UPI002E2453DA
MRKRNALALSVAAATIVPVALTGTSAVASGSSGAQARSSVAAARAPVGAARPEAAPGAPAPNERAPRADRPAGQADAPVAEAGAARSADRFADQQPVCGKASDPLFPIATRIHGGPETQQPGAGPQTWSVDLRNTTREMCHHIHPVIILTGGPGLTADRVAMEFYDESEARWRPVMLERTTQDELVGAFDDGFPGFVVPAERTVSVKVRIALDAGTPPNAVTVNAAIVQRQGADGDWVGESGDYRFEVVEADRRTPAPGDSPTATSSPSDTGSATATAPPTALTDELATTGSRPRLVIAAAVGAVVLSAAGALLLLVRRRPGSRRR